MEIDKDRGGDESLGPFFKKLPLGLFPGIDLISGTFANLNITEIRIEIWRLLFRRPVAIAPGYLSRQWLGPAWNRQLVGEYSYLWDEACQRTATNPNDYFHGGPASESLPQAWLDSKPLTITIISKPTIEQSMLICKGIKALPLTMKPEIGKQISCQVVRRGQHGLQIVNQISLVPCILFGAAMLRTCKQISAECVQVLYGENTFAFSTGLFSPFSPQGEVHEWDELEKSTNFIPGLPQNNGKPQLKSETTKALDKLFSPSGYQPPFVKRDPLLLFMGKIGRHNASFITNVKIDGFMKTSYRPFPRIPMAELPSHLPLGFARILPILTTVLENCCPRLRKLTLHMEDQIYPRPGMQALWDDAPYNKIGGFDEERIDQIVSKVIEQLTSLKELQLGGYQTFNLLKESPDTEFVDEWGKSARWIWLVEKRARDTQIEETKGTK